MTGAFPYLGVCLMRSVFCVEEGVIGWRVRQGATGLAEALTLASAIKRARKLGRDYHERTGSEVTVELVIPEKSLLLEQHPRRTLEATAAA